jgi:uracil-DNA glycosylase
MKSLIARTKRWIEQERVWDDSLYCSRGEGRGARGEDAKGRDGVIARSPEVPATVAISGVQRAGIAASPAATSPRAPRNDNARASELAGLYEKYKDCTRCLLGRTRIKFVFGVGPADAKVIFIGEGPGYEEDRRGEPFVGKAGQLLDRMLAAIEMSRKTNAYIANIVKCHPMANPQTPEARGNDRPPHPEESEACSPILLRQIAVIQPRVIVTLGSPSTKMMLRTKEGITGLRGKFFPFAVDAFYPPQEPKTAGLWGSTEPSSSAPERLSIDPATREALRRIQVLPTYHPAALLRNPNLKPESWADLKLLRDTLARP